MKILLSAYACEPNKGSEPGVGWSWCTELAKFHDVWVITRDNNKPTITKYLSENPECKNDRLHFIYVGLSKKLTFWKKGRRGMRLFYDLWQRKAVKVAKKYHDHIHFDIVQHVTFVSYTQPTYMYKLKIPMIWGPVSGGENIPVEIKLNLSVKEKIIENIRKLSQELAVIYPCIRKTMRDSKLIIVATEETKMKIPSKYWSKMMLVPAIGVSKIPDIEIHKREDGKIKVVMAGRLIYWKAFDIGIKAFLKIADEHPKASLHILGEGDKKKLLKKIAGDYLDKQVFFDKPVEHDKIYEYYSTFDIFLNTTLRDSGCMTMMEAMSVEVPCIAVATGGPKVLLNDFPDCSVSCKQYDLLVDDIADRLKNMIIHSNARKDIALKQQTFIRENMTMNNKVKKIESWLSQV